MQPRQGRLRRGLHRGDRTGAGEARPDRWARPARREMGDGCPCGLLPRGDRHGADRASAGRFGAIARRSTAGQGPASTPRPRSDGEISGVSYQQFLSLCRQRRSVRWFEQRPVPQEHVSKALDAAAQAPSAATASPSCSGILASPKTRAASQLSPWAPRLRAQRTGTGRAARRPELLSGGARPPRRVYRRVACGDAVHAGARDVGTSILPDQLADIEYREREMAEALGLPWHLRPVMLIALGYADPRGGSRSPPRSQPVAAQDEQRLHALMAEPPRARAALNPAPGGNQRELVAG